MDLSSSDLNEILLVNRSEYTFDEFIRKIDYIFKEYPDFDQACKSCTNFVCTGDSKNISHVYISLVMNILYYKQNISRQQKFMLHRDIALDWNTLIWGLEERRFGKQVMYHAIKKKIVELNHFHMDVYNDDFKLEFDDYMLVIYQDMNTTCRIFSSSKFLFNETYLQFFNKSPEQRKIIHYICEKFSKDQDLPRDVAALWYCPYVRENSFNIVYDFTKKVVNMMHASSASKKELRPLSKAPSPTQVQSKRQRSQ